MEIILSVLKYWKQILAVALIVGAYMFGAHVKDQEWQLKWEQENSAHVSQIAQIQGDYNTKQTKIATDFMDYLHGRDVRIGQLKKELENVKTQNDGSCTLLGGTIDLHDRLSMAMPKTGTGDGTGSTNGGLSFDATPSGIALSTLLETVGDNYNICNTEIKKLEALQGVVRTFQEEQKKVTK